MCSVFDHVSAKRDAIQEEENGDWRRRTGGGGFVADDDAMCTAIPIHVPLHTQAHYLREPCIACHIFCRAQVNRPMCTRRRVVVPKGAAYVDLRSVLMPSTLENATFVSSPSARFLHCKGFHPVDFPVASYSDSSMLIKRIPKYSRNGASPPPRVFVLKKVYFYLRLTVVDLLSRRVVFALSQCGSVNRRRVEELPFFPRACFSEPLCLDSGL